MKPVELSRSAPWLVVVALASQVALSWLYYPGDRDAYTRELALTRAVGWSALLALCAALCVSPIGRLLRTVHRGSDAWQREVRRVLGIAAASAGIAHATLALLALPGPRANLLETPQLRAGLAALLALTLLLITSFPSAVRGLRWRSWKELHRLAYPALALAFLHLLQSPYVPLRSALWLLGGTLTIGLLRLLPDHE
jgi:DMSO/TMAO reductase YedYZ heme-binding membrane subunit